MAHNIVNNQLAFVGEVPWHGLGVQVQAGMTGAEMLKIAGLDWKVQRRRIAMRDALGKAMLVQPLDNFRAIVRHDTDQVFQIASDSYFPMQNQDIVEFFREYCEAGNAQMETVGGINGGSTVWALAKLAADADLGAGDLLRGYMLLATSHDGSVRTIGQPTDVRVVCNNTFSAAISEKSKARFAMKHTRKWTPEVAKEAKQIMGMAIEQIQQTNELMQKFSKIKMDADAWFGFAEKMGCIKQEDEQPVDLDNLSQEAIDKAIAGYAVDMEPALESALVTVTPSFDIEKLNRVGKSIFEATLNSPGSDLDTAKGTAWGVLNGVTYYVDHQRSRKQDLRLQNAWFGSGDAMKTKAIVTLKEMAGIQ